MAKNTKDVYGADGTTSLLSFDPLKLKIVTDPQHALYDERIHLPLDEAMVLNIMANGVIQPITITKDAESGDTLVVTGRQRVRHAIEANKRLGAQGQPLVLVPASITKLKTNALGALLISENEIRRPDGPVVRAEKMAREMSRGRDEAWLATQFGCTVQTVRKTLALLEQPAAVRKAVEAGQITADAAHKLSKLTPEDQRAKVAAMVKVGEGATGHAKARAQRAVLEDTQPRMKTRKQIADELAASAGERRAALAWVLGEVAEA